MLIAGSNRPPAFSEEVKSLLTILIPSFFSGLIGSLGAFGNVALLGRVDAVELAGGAVGAGMLILVGALAGGGGTALEPLIGQALGRGDWDRIATARTKGTIAIVSIAAPTSLLVLAASLLLEKVGVEAPVAHRARLLLLTSVPLALLQPIWVALSATLVAIGAPKAALRASIFATATQFVLGLLLIHGGALLEWLHLPSFGVRGLGVVGAGLASDLSLVVMVAVGQRAFVAERRLALAGLRPASSASPPAAEAVGVAGGDDATLPITAGSILRMALPVSIVITGEVAVGIVLTLFAGRLGPDEMSAYRIVTLIPEFVEPVLWALAAATVTRVSWAVGAGNDPKPRARAGILLSALFTASFALVLVLLPGSVVPSLVTADAEVVRSAAPLVKTAGPFLVLLGLGHSIAAALRGASDFGGPAVIQGLGSWLVSLPLAWFLAFRLHMGVSGLWVGWGVGIVTVALALAVRYRIVFARPIKRL